SVMNLPVLNTLRRAQQKVVEIQQMPFFLPVFISLKSLLPCRIINNAVTGQLTCKGILYSGFSARYLLQKFSGFCIYTCMGDNLFCQQPLLCLSHQSKFFSLLFQEIQTDRVKGSDLHRTSRLLLSCLFFNTLPHLCRRLIRECDSSDLRRA